MKDHKCHSIFCYIFPINCHYSRLSLFVSHRAVLVENIPEDVPFSDNSTSHLPLAEGLYNLLDRALRVVEIVSPLWLLNSSDYESSFQPAARQVTGANPNITESGFLISTVLILDSHYEKCHSKTTPDAYNLKKSYHCIVKIIQIIS